MCDLLESIDKEKLSLECRTVTFSKFGKDKIAELASDKEVWYSLYCTALFQLKRFDECLQFSKEAFEAIPKFHYNNDIWFSRKISLCQRELGNFEIAIQGLEAIVRKKTEWFIQKEIAELYFEKGEVKEFTTAIENSPDLAIGTAKELIETICNTILEERGIEVDKNWDLLQLLKQTTKQLQLTPDGIPDTIKASKSIKSILGSLTTVVQGLSELRNQYGTGHGKKASFKGLTLRHAKLSVGAASTLAIFLLETHKYRT